MKAHPLDRIAPVTPSMRRTANEIAGPLADLSNSLETVKPSLERLVQELIAEFNRVIEAKLAPLNRQLAVRGWVKALREQLRALNCKTPDLAAQLAVDLAHNWEMMPRALQCEGLLLAVCDRFPNLQMNHLGPVSKLTQSLEWEEPAPIQSIPLEIGYEEHNRLVEQRKEEIELQRTLLRRFAVANQNLVADWLSRAVEQSLTPRKLGNRIRKAS
jgi:hypothetical protein